MNKKNILIVGATSAIAKAIIKQYAQDNHRLYLLARNAQRLNALSQDLKLRTQADIYADMLDANDFSRHAEVINTAVKHMGGIDQIIIAHGSLPKQKEIEDNFAKIQEEINTNFLSAVSLLTHVVPHMQAKKSGSIIVISSVAGDRGRQDNYIYGSAKSALSVYLQGLRNRLYKEGISVLTVKPGFVDTPMTAELKKNLLFAKPLKVAQSIIKANNKKKDVLYTPFFWRPIMQIIRLIPEKIFKRLSI